MEDVDLTERLITAGEFATILCVTENDVVRWMLAGRIPYVDGCNGEPLVRVRERHSVDGPLASGIIVYSIDDEPAFQTEVADRRRELQLEATDTGDVDVDALADALASRLGAVAPSGCRIAVDRAMVLLHDDRGCGAGIDISVAASYPDCGSGAQRVRSAGATLLAQAQDELAELTTDPWPRHGPGALPTPRAVLVDGDARVRLLYGAVDDPVLELEPIRVSEVVAEP